MWYNGISSHNLDSSRRLTLLISNLSCKELIQKELVKKDIPYYLITGDTSPKRRVEMCDEFNKSSSKEKVFLIVISAILSVVFNNQGWIGYMPLVSTIVYVVFMNIKDIKKFKILTIVTVVLWLIYDFYIKSYTAALFDFMTIITSIIAIIQIIRRKSTSK